MKAVVRKSMLAMASIAMVIGLVLSGEPQTTYASGKQNKNNTDLVIVLDPGHGGHDGGATKNHNGTTYIEKNLNLRIAQYCKEELEQYDNVKVYMTRDTDVYVGLEERVQYAASVDADLFVSIHNNSEKGSSSYGAEVYYPNSNYTSKLETNGYTVAKRISEQLAGVGLKNNGVRSRSSEEGYRYADGSFADYYSVIRGSKKAGFTGLIVEHAYISNRYDATTFLGSEEMLKKLGIADATGIANYFALTKNQESVSVSYSTHVQTYGWQNWVSNGVMAGTTGEAKRLESIRIAVTGDANLGVTYKTHVQSDGWLNNSYNGNPNGTAGQAKRLEAIMIALTGADANKYDIYYRVHAESYGWLGWAKNGEPAGTAGQAKRLEGIQILVVPAGESFDINQGGITSNYEQAYIATDTIVPDLDKAGIEGKAHVQSIGWQNAVYSGDTLGTTGKSLRVEAVSLELIEQEYEGGISYQAHVQDIGWQDEKRDGEIAGTTGQARRVEALRINLYGEVAEHYDVYYRAHVQSIGWQDWIKNGELAGTEGQALRMEAIQVKLVEKKAE